MNFDHAAAGCRQFAGLHQPARDDAVDRRAQLGEAAPGGGLRSAGARRIRCRAGGLQVGVGLVERRLADETLGDEALRPVVLELRLRKRRLGLRHLGAPAGDLRVGLAGVDARQQLAALDAVACVDQKLRQLAGDLRRDRGLAHRLDDRVGGVDVVDLAQLDGRRAGSHPEVLILDEPTSGLDPNQIVEIRNLIKQLGRAKTVVLSTHILSEVQATCDRVLIINEGKIVADGSPQALQREFTGGEKLTLQLKTGAPDPVAEIVPKLKIIAYVANVTLNEHHEDVSTFEIQVDKGQDVREAAFRLAVSENWVILEMHRATTTLEEVFHKLTTA